MKNRLYRTLLFIGAFTLFNGCSFSRINEHIRNLTQQISHQQEQIAALNAETSESCIAAETDEETCASFRQALEAMSVQSERWKREIIYLAQKNAPLRAPFLNKSAQEMVVEYMAKHQRYQDLIRAMTGLLRDESKMRPFETAAYYPPGKYEVPEDKKQVLQEALKPTLQGIKRFKTEYPYFPCVGKVEVNGYADRTGIREGSGLYEELKSELKVEAPTRSELNRQLSHWRAEGIGNLMKTIPYGSEVVIKAIGKGELDPPGAHRLPAGSVLKDDDPRRRIVVVYWGCPVEKSNDLD
ncbi:MAG: hypothetical protein JNN12_17265 [Bacteroidetes Order II. Incertae sedis bacterium]|nr:hypothetical protein [Bacteroidetes Order II. bacterium]